MRRLALVTALLVPVAAAVPARADWQVHRTDSSALVERAERALLERPDDDDLARRLVKLAGRDGRTKLRERFRARAERASAEGGKAAYAPLAAYAHLLQALGDAKAASAAFDQVLRAAPQSVPALAGRARALADTGDDAGALAAYDDALKLEHRAPARRRLIDAALAILARSGDAPDKAAQDRTIALLRELARAEPDSDEIAERLADALERAGKPVAGAEVLEARLRPGHAAAKLELGAARRAPAARRPAIRPTPPASRAPSPRCCASLPPGDAERRRAVWAVAFTVARSRGTLPELARELERAPGPVEWDVLGRVRDALGDLEGALAATRSALAAAPRDVELGRRVIALHDQLGNETQATATLEELVRRLPDDPAAGGRSDRAADAARSPRGSRRRVRSRHRPLRGKPERAAAARDAGVAFGRGSARAEDVAAAAQARSRQRDRRSSASASPSFRSA